MALLATKCPFLCHEENKPQCLCNFFPSFLSLRRLSYATLNVISVYYFVNVEYTAAISCLLTHRNPLQGRGIGSAGEFLVNYTASDPRLSQ
jgi:hypothetical protein